MTTWWWSEASISGAIGKDWRRSQSAPPRGMRQYWSTSGCGLLWRSLQATCPVPVTGSTPMPGLKTSPVATVIEAAFTHGGAWRAGSAFLAGATVFIVVDSLLERRKEGRRAAGMGIGFALLAAVTLDGVPENIAMGVALVDTGNAALLVAIFVSNFPEAVVGAEKMREAGLERGAILLIWTATAVLLGVSVIVGYGAFSGLSGEALSWPLGFAGGAVLASLADTLMPEAFEEAKEDPRIAYFTSLGFLLSFLVAAA